MYPRLLSLLLLTLPLSVLGQTIQTSSYFNILSPDSSSVWSSDALNVITWQTSPNEGIDFFDLELTRLNTDGILFVAKNVPISPPAINIQLTDILPGSDYFFLFLNSTDGQNFAVSNQFTIATSNSSTTIAAGNPTAGSPTVTVSGTPNPLVGFQTTLAAGPNGAVSLSIPKSTLVAGLIALCSMFYYL